VDGAARQGRGLTVGDVREDAKYFSGQASTNIRYIATAGLAGAWAVSGGSLAAFRARCLSAALVLFVAVLGVDLLHYSESARRLARALEKAQEERLGLDSPAEFDGAPTPAAVLFRVKFWLVVLGCVTLGVAFVQAVRTASVSP
jgi:hypothetical protein